MTHVDPPVARGDEHDELVRALPAYRIGDLLGRGSFASVFVASHTRLGREVAVKRLSPALLPDQEARARFATEARLLAALDHPHVVRVYDYVESEGVCALVMERLRGGSLSERMRVGRLPRVRAVAFMIAALSGLEHAHRRGIVHRDVKPENLLFGEDDLLKVADFGIAKVLEGQPLEFTATAATLGTPAFMAPEQVSRKLGPLSAATDVWAIGAILYELLSGQPPFPRDVGLAEALLERISGAAPPLSERAPDLPVELTDAVMRALAVDPGGRYAAALAFADALAAAADLAFGAGSIAATGILIQRPTAGAHSSQTPTVRAAGTVGPAAPDVPGTGPGARIMRTPVRRVQRAQRALLERHEEIQAIALALDDTRAGDGTLLAITAPAGMGKTRLLQEAANAAQARGLQVLSGRGVEFEREFPFGVVRQLFEPALMRLAGRDREELLGGAAAPAGNLLLGQRDASPMGEVAVDHALFWLVANLALGGPLALVVDDAHWADRPSLRALLHLAVRLEDLPVAIALAARPSEPGAHQDLLDRLAEDPLARHLRPQALSCSSAAALLEGRLQEVDPAFSAACHTATGGNPFVIEELASALAAAGVSPTAANADRVAHVGPETVARSVVLRLRAQSAEAGALARALAIHGGSVPLRLAARTAGIDERAAGEAADSLAKVDILAPGRPLEFAHPTVRAAVYQSLPRSERSAGHRAAAAMLFADGAAPETIASHLLHTEPAGDSWVVGRLAGAAEAARSVGALDSTVTYLKRALEEPAPAEQRAALLIGLGAGHRHRNEWDDSADALRAAIREAPEATLRVEAARQLFTLMLPYRRDSETAAELQDLLAELRAQEPDLALELELTLTDSMLLDSDLAPALAARIRGMDVSASGAERRDRIMCARRAWVSLGAGDSAEDTRSLARAALQSGELIAEDGRAHGFEMSVIALALTDQLTEAQAHIGDAMDAARRRGHMGRWGFLSATAAHVDLMQGRILEAEEHARQAIDVLRPDGIAFPAALDALVEALLERGETTLAAEAREQHADPGPLPDPLLYPGLRLGPARLAWAAGDLPGALDSVLTIGRRQVALGRPNPAWCPWRSTAALIHLQLGSPAPARALADEELALAREYGADRALGVALRVAGLCRGADGVGHLREAVATLESSGAELERARALVELGAAVRRKGQRGDAAREPLRAGREIAERLGAAPLAAHALEELRASGARPRRVALSGLDALTPSERRVCDLAVTGMTNREIAQALFISIKSVEGHLASSYAKLDITRKHELAGVMAPAG